VRKPLQAETRLPFSRSIFRVFTLRMDALRRTSRWYRGSTKPVQLTPRDLGILSLLQRYRYASTEHIHAFVGGQKNRLQERLARLYREPNCYINRPAQQRQYFNANYRPILYELDQNGERALRGRGHLDDDAAVTWLNCRRDGRTDFAHAVMVCEALASIELGVRGNPSLRFVGWPEIKARIPEAARKSKLLHCLPARISHQIKSAVQVCDKALAPDVVFGIAYEGHGARFFALECDRDSEPLRRTNLQQTSYMRKLLQYRQVLRERAYHSQWGIPNLLVLNLTTSELHMRKIVALAEELCGDIRPFLLFKAMPSLGDFAPPEPPTGRLLTEAWVRPGLADFRLDQAIERG
jgi:hypothetical protein